MAFCKKCGAEIDSDATFCSACGANQGESFVGMTLNEPVQKSSGSINIGLMIWSIINLIMCCTPLGIASLVMVVLAKDAPSIEDEAKKLKTAKICNAIGTIGGFVGIVVYVAFVVAAAMSGAQYY